MYHCIQYKYTELGRVSIESGLQEDAERSSLHENLAINKHLVFIAYSSCQNWE